MSPVLNETLEAVQPELKMARNELEQLLTALARAHTAPGEQHARRALQYVTQALKRLGFRPTGRPVEVLRAG
jgi:hypothetical protein